MDLGRVAGYLESSESTMNFKRVVASFFINWAFVHKDLSIHTTFEQCVDKLYKRESQFRVLDEDYIIVYK